MWTKKWYLQVVQKVVPKSGPKSSHNVKGGALLVSFPRLLPEILCILCSWAFHRKGGALLVSFPRLLPEILCILCSWAFHSYYCSHNVKGGALLVSFPCSCKFHDNAPLNFRGGNFTQRYYLLIEECSALARALLIRTIGRSICLSVPLFQILRSF